MLCCQLEKIWQKIFEGEKIFAIAGKYDFHGRSVLPLIGVGSNSILVGGGGRNIHCNRGNLHCTYEY